MFVVTRKPRRLRLADRVDRLVEDALALDGLVVALAHAVEVDDPGEVRRRLEQVELLLHQDRVRAQVDELLALDQLLARSRGSRGGRAARRRRSRPSARPHSSIAASACSTGIRCLRMCSGCWIFPQTEQARLHWKSGSSSTSSGNLLVALAAALAHQVPADGKRSGGAGRSLALQPPSEAGSGASRWSASAPQRLSDRARPARRRAGGRSARAPTRRR